MILVSIRSGLAGSLSWTDWPMRTGCCKLLDALDLMKQYGDLRLTESGLSAG